MQTSLFIMVIALHVVCKGQEICEVFPKNQLVKYGSEVVVYFRAPYNSDCHKRTGFDPSRVSWKLNNRVIANDSYRVADNSNFSVSIPNFSLTKGTVEFLMDENVLSGTVIRTFTAPQNISCIGNVSEESLTCTWDHDQYTRDTSYRVILKVRDLIYDETTSTEKSSKLKAPIYVTAKMSITVIAETPAGNATSDEVTYDDVSDTVKLDPPQELKVEPVLNGLTVTWSSSLKWSAFCQVQFLEDGSEPVVKNAGPVSSFALTDLKECTNYSISVRCGVSFFSDWSPNKRHLTHLNVSYIQLHLWRSRSITYNKGERKIHLMWKGIPPSCEDFDQYRLFDQTGNIILSRLNRNQNHTFIHLDENMHRISVAAFRNNESLGEASIEIPATEEDLHLPSVNNVSMFTGGGQIYITWDAPNLTVTGYLIVWNTSEENHMWHQTQETHFSLKGKNFTCYTISVTPLYEDRPGNEVQLLAYAQEKYPAVVMDVRADKITDSGAEIHWRPILATECCGFVLSYTVFYKTQNEPVIRAVNVDKSQHILVLDGLKFNTTYEVYVHANAAEASSESIHYMFSTKLYGENFLIGIIVGGVGLILLPVFAVLFVMLRRQYLSEKFPNPRLSSLSVWSSTECTHLWNQLPMTWGSESEEILKCQLEAEDRDVGKPTGSAADHNFTTQEATATAEKENAASVQPNETKLVSHGKEEKRQPLLSADSRTSQIYPVLLTRTPYKKQVSTNIGNSPRRVFQGNAKACSSEETQTLLKTKPQNITCPVSYVTVDMFQQLSTKKGVP